MNKFSFKPVEKDDIRDEIDQVIGKKQTKQVSKIDKPVMDRIRFAHEIKHNPPKPDFMKTDIKPGLYSIDLNTDAHWWFNHVCTVFPLLVDQAIRTHVDIKDSFKVEKRRMDFNLTYIIIFIIGLAGFFIFMRFFGFI